MSDTNIVTHKVTYQKQLAKQMFDQIEHLPWSMLLRSASDSHPNSRFDILVHSPIVTVETYGDISEVRHQGKIELSTKDPFELLRELQQLYLPKWLTKSASPFIGGWLGYFAYDLGRRVEKIGAHAQKDLNAPDMAVGLYEQALIVDHLEKQAYWIGQNLTSAMVVEDKPGFIDFSLTAEWSSNMTKSEYATKFYRVQDYLKAGDCYQINLAQRFHAQYQGSEWHAYQKLEQENLAPFSAFIRLPQNTILSVSPERFLLCDAAQVETKPIKGTRPRHPDPVEDRAQINDLLTAEKDQAENLMIVDLLRNDIGRVSKPGTVRVPHLFEIESFPAVHHLVSTVTGILDEQYDVYDLLRACFPGGSITGAPKVRAMQIIEELEPHRRSVYCGSIGYISRCGNMDTSITIRTLITENQQIYAWAGGGLVADSECDSEYQETLHKLGKILPILKEC